METALSELPTLCAGDLATAPACDLGSNAALPEAERRVPKAIIFGGAFGEEDVETVMAAVTEKAGGKEVPQVVRMTRADILAKGATGPNPGVIAEVLREKIGGMVAAGKL